MAKIKTNPNAMVGKERLKPGTRIKKRDDESQKQGLKMVSARIPQETAEKMDEILAEVNKDRKRISKQDYIAEILKNAISEDAAKLEAGERLDY